MTEKRQRTEDLKIPPSIFAINPVPDIESQVSDWLKTKVKEAVASKQTLSRSDKFKSIEIEIEAKLGTIIDRQTRQRVSFPIYSETIINNTFKEFSFESNMSISQHSRFNAFLNGFVNEKSKIKYVHLYEIDQFFDIPGLGKVRNTIDDKTGRQKNCIIKQKMGNLEIYMPSSNLDYRISVNLEMVLRTPQEDEYPTHSRKKDRLSYSLPPFQVDLTQVTNQGGDQSGEKMHEIEVEFTDSKEFTHEIVQDGPVSKKSLEYINSFLNNIRILARKG